MYDAIVVGGGPAGISAALWLARYRRRVLLVDSDERRNRWVEHSHGYFTRDSAPPHELIEAGMEQLCAYPYAERLTGRVTEARRDGDEFVLTMDGTEHRALRVVLATGVQDAFPEIEGFFDHYGADVFHCPTCDGYEAQGKNVVVIGWSEHVAAFALTLLDWAASVVVVTDGREFDGDHQTLASYGVAVFQDEALRFVGTRGDLRGIVLKTMGELPCEMAFFSVAHNPRNELAISLGAEIAEDEGCVLVDDENKTSVDGLYACGDLTPGMQLIQVAASKGTVAGIAAAQSLRGQRGAPASPPPAPDPMVVAPS